MIYRWHKPTGSDDLIPVAVLPPDGDDYGPVIPADVGALMVDALVHAESNGDARSARAMTAYRAAVFPGHFLAKCENG